MITPQSDTLKLAFRTPDTVEARALAMELNAAGVNVQITGDYSDTAYPGLAIGGMANKELWIAESDWTETQPIVERWMQTHHPDDVAQSPPKLQFSLRTLLIGMTLLAIAIVLAKAGPDVAGTAISASFAGIACLAVLAWARRLRKHVVDGDESAHD